MWMPRSRDQDHPGQHDETPSLLKIKIKKINWAWWCAPVFPATWEAEAGELLEPRRWRFATALQPGNRARLSLKKQTNNNKKQQ